MATSQQYTFDSVREKLVEKAARQIHRRYKNDGTDYDEARSIIYVWMYTPSNRQKIERWLANEPQQTSRIYWSMYGVAQRSAERTRAELRGYSPDDIHWYTAEQVQALLPLALNENYDGQQQQDRDREEDLNKKVSRSQVNHKEGGDVLAMVMDVRRAIAAVGSTDPARLVDWLGGGRNPVGSRRVISNASAQARTGADYGD